jgi:hypothetical protein
MEQFVDELIPPGFREITTTRVVEMPRHAMAYLKRRDFALLAQSRRQRQQ